MIVRRVGSTPEKCHLKAESTYHDVDIEVFSTRIEVNKVGVSRKRGRPRRIAK